MGGEEIVWKEAHIALLNFYGIHLQFFFFLIMFLMHGDILKIYNSKLETKYWEEYNVYLVGGN